MPIILRRTRLKENKAVGLGAGLLFDPPDVDGPDSLVERSLFTGNIADGQGGAIAAIAGSLRIANTTISGNSALGGRGDSLLVLADGNVAATNVTFANDSPNSNLANYAILSLQNSIVHFPTGQRLPGWGQPGDATCALARQ